MGVMHPISMIDEDFINQIRQLYGFGRPTFSLGLPGWEWEGGQNFLFVNMSWFRGWATLMEAVFVNSQGIKGFSI